MFYLVTVAIQSLRATRYQSFRVANYHNAAAFQRAFDGVPTIEVSIEPDLAAYLNYVGVTSTFSNNRAKTSA